MVDRIATVLRKPLRDVFCAASDGRKARVIEEFLSPDSLQECADLLIGVDREGDPAICGLHRLVMRTEEPKVARRSDRRIETLLRKMFLQDEG
ncbi:hypothetical protein PQR53_05885 [Paraburkholderia fungorum]